MNEKEFASAPIGRLFVRCTVPAMVGMGFSAIYSITDGIFVGHYIGQEALAAVNLVMPLIMIITAFKVYACDCGLLRRLAHLPASVVTDPIANYSEFKEAMAENVVLQSIMPQLDGMTPNYWTSDRKAEVEFVIQWDDKIIPIEVKAAHSISGNSLAEYNKKYAPSIRIRFSMLNLQYNGGLLSCPSPLAGWLDKLLELCLAHHIT